MFLIRVEKSSSVSNLVKELGTSVSNLDSLFRRLLGSTTETNYTAVGSRPWRTRPCKNYLPPDPPAKTIYRRRLCLATTAHFSDYNSLSTHTQCAWASRGLIPSTAKVNHKKSFLIAQMAQQVSVANKSQWQHKIRQNANKQHANRQALGSVPQPRSGHRSFSSTTESFLLLLLLLQHKNDPKKGREARR